MRRGHRLAMECAGPCRRFPIDRGKLILGIVVERILKTPLEVTTALGLVFEIPSHGASQRLFRR